MLPGPRLGHVRRALLALAAGGFAIGTSEFLMLGLLPQVADDLSVSIPQAGQLISAYALGVVVGAPLLTAASVRFPRKTVLIVLMSWYAVFNLLSALAPTFLLVLMARFGTGLPHGAFFGVGSVVASSIAPAGRRNQAMSVMFTGLTVANVVGVPISTLLGQGTSWRLVYGLIAVVALIAVVLIALGVPDLPSDTSATALRSELRTFRDARIWLVLAVATLGGAGLFATFSYIAPMLTRQAGYAESSITWLLVLFGVGMTLGNLVGARLADHFPTVTIVVALSSEIVLALVFALTTHSKVLSAVLVLLLPATALAGLPALQGRVIQLAGGAANLAAASIQAAFNVANSIGAYFGGLAISAGFGYASPNVVAAILVSFGLAATAVLVRAERRVRDIAARTDPAPVTV
jgi:MFS transporter, DHA1 family, inner membrane transport protein